MFTIMALAVYKEKKNQINASQYVINLDFPSPKITSVCSERFSQSGSFDGQMHVMQYLMRNL